MANLTFYAAAVLDDGHRTNTPDYVAANNNLWWGTAAYLGSFVRFGSVSGVSQGQTIASAQLRLYKYTAQLVGGAATIYGVDADNQGQIADGDEAAYDALSPTTATASLPGANWAGNTWYSWDVTSIVQEIINRGSWAGTSICFKIVDVNSSVAARWYAYDFNAGQFPPELIIALASSQVYTGAADATALDDSSDGMTLTPAAADATALGDSIDGAAPKGYTTDATALGDSSDAMNLAATAADATALGDSLATQTEYGSTTTSDAAALGDTIAAWSLSDALTDATDLGDAVDGTREGYEALADATALGDAMDGLNWTQYWLANRDKTTRTYELTLTGAADGKADVKLPMSSFQARLYSGDQSYLQVVVPSVTEYGDYVTDRPNGELVLEMVGTVAGTEVLRIELLRVDLESARSDIGTRSESITLDGHKTVTYGARTTALENVTYYYTQDGAYTFRCAEPDWWLKPGHTATYDGNSFTVDEIVTWASVTERSVQAYMEVNE